MRGSLARLTNWTETNSFLLSQDLTHSLPPCYLNFLDFKVSQIVQIEIREPKFHSHTQKVDNHRDHLSKGAIGRHEIEK